MVAIKSTDSEVIREGRKRAAPQVLAIHEAVRAEGEHELARPVAALAISGLAAGLSMGFSFLAEAAITAGLPDREWTYLISKFGYSVGFLIVILGRQQLFTENTLTPILALFSHPTLAVLKRLSRLWFIVLSANLVGAAVFAGFLAFTPVFDAEMDSTLKSVSTAIFEPGAQANFLRGILGGWLIALMVWLLPYAGKSRIWIIVILTYLIGIGHLAHIIAGSVEAFYAVFVSAISFLGALKVFLLPALFGNIVGGVALVSTLHHAQVHFDQHNDDDDDVFDSNLNSANGKNEGLSIKLDAFGQEYAKKQGASSESPES